ncbi:MAG: DUF4336 domain-containing protein [Myxococcota bacterium]
MLRQIDENLWVAESPLRFLGLEMGARMTAIRLPDGSVFLHSPVALTEKLKQEIEAVGPVKYLIAPNKLHHLFVSDWVDAFPDAIFYAAPDLDKKRPDLDCSRVLGNSAEAGWSGTIDQVRVDGFPFASEIAFFHRPSKTFIATDLAFNIGDNSPPLTQAFFRMARTHGRLSPTLLERLLIRDRGAFKTSFERILEWPFERIIVSHGDISETGGREQLLQGYAWLP